MKTKHLLSLITGGLFCLSSTQAAEPSEAPRLPLVHGRMTILSELSSKQSPLFALPDPDRPGAWCWFQDERVVVDTANPEMPILLTGVVTYTNPNYLAERKCIFNGVRSRGFDSNFVVSDDLGKTWRYGGRSLDANDPWPKARNGGRTYVNYAGDGKSKIHLFATDDHPRVNFNEERTAPGPLLNSIYYAYIEGNKLYRAAGEVIDENLSDGKATPPPAMTPLLKDGIMLGPDAMRRGWIVDIHVDAAGHPFGIIQFRANDNPVDHRYFYVRFDGAAWQVSFLAYGGDYFGFEGEPDYTGLAAVDPSNPDVVFISTSSDPTTGKALISTATQARQNEIFMGRTADGGKTWCWAPLTENSKVDNLRPIVPTWAPGKSVVLWMKGNYPKFIQYDTRIVGRIVEHTKRSPLCL